MKVQPNCNRDPSILVMSAPWGNYLEQQQWSGACPRIEDKVCVLQRAELEKRPEPLGGSPEDHEWIPKDREWTPEDREWIPKDREQIPEDHEWIPERSRTGSQEISGGSQKIMKWDPSIS